MIQSLILRTTSRWLAPAMLVCSVWLLLRGHDAPGGGFVGGLVAVAAFLLRALAQGSRAVRESLRLAPASVLALGLLASLASALAGPLAGAPWMQGVWWTGDVLGMHLALGTPLLFDVGVYLVVLGSGLAVILGTLEEE